MVDTKMSEEEVSEEVIKIITSLLNENENNQSLNSIPDKLKKEYVIKECDLNKYNKQNSRKIHIIKTILMDQSLNTIILYRREYNDVISYLVSINNNSTRAITKEEKNHFLSTCHILSREEYDELSVYENNQYFTIRDYGEGKVLISDNEEMLLPKNIELNRSYQKKLQK